MAITYKHCCFNHGKIELFFHLCYHSCRNQKWRHLPVVSVQQGNGSSERHRPLLFIRHKPVQQWHLGSYYLWGEIGAFVVLYEFDQSHNNEIVNNVEKCRWPCGYVCFQYYWTFWEAFCAHCLWQINIQCASIHWYYNHSPIMLWNLKTIVPNDKIFDSTRQNRFSC